VDESVSKDKGDEAKDLPINWSYQFSSLPRRFVVLSFPGLLVSLLHDCDAQALLCRHLLQGYFCQEVA
jgi:hypothetical protein